MSGSNVLTLLHGTTRLRAAAILSNGPDRWFVEPDGAESLPARGFSTFPVGRRPRDGDPDAAEYARMKADLFPDEGGPCILQVEVPERIVRGIRGTRSGAIIDAYSGEIRFEPGNGLEELLTEWSRLTKRVIPV